MSGRLEVRMSKITVTYTSKSMTVHQLRLLVKKASAPQSRLKWYLNNLGMIPDIEVTIEEVT